jgi:hypothetical protein
MCGVRVFPRSHASKNLTVLTLTIVQTLIGRQRLSLLTPTITPGNSIKKEGSNRESYILIDNSNLLCTSRILIQTLMIIGVIQTTQRISCLGDRPRFFRRRPHNDAICWQLQHIALSLHQDEETET